MFCQKCVSRCTALLNWPAPLARVTALMAPAEVPTITGNGLAALAGNSSAMPASTPT